MINKIPWSKPCLLVGCVSTKAGLIHLGKTTSPADIVEVRLDIFKKAGVELEIIEKALETRKRPVLLTLRTTDEGGVYPWKSRERVVLFHQLIPKVDVIDLELANAHLIRPILKFARQAGCPIILSAHSLRRKLTLRKMDRLLREFRGYRAEVYKIVSMARTKKDLGLLALTLIDNPRTTLAIMGVGPMSAASRMVLPILGSKLVYGYLDTPIFKEQPSIEQVAQSLGTFGV